MIGSPVHRVITIDPSGTGTTGFFTDDMVMYGTKTFVSDNWQAHFDFIVDELKIGRYEMIVIETISPGRTNRATNHLIDLAKLIGCLENHLRHFENVVWVKAQDTKRLGKKLKEMEFGQELYNIKKIKIGRKTVYRHFYQDLSSHEIDSVAIYHIWLNRKQYIERTETKRKVKKNDK